MSGCSQSTTASAGWRLWVCFIFFFPGLKTVWRSGPGLICVYACAFLTLIGLEITLPVLLNSSHLADPELGLKEDLSAWLSLVTPCPVCDPMHLHHWGGVSSGAGAPLGCGVR